MIIVSHIIIALISVILSALVFFKPKKSTLYTTYILTALTLISGAYLVATTHASMTAACITGIVYISIVLIGLVPAHNKLKVNSKI